MAVSSDLEELEKKIKKSYKEAKDDINAKWKAYMSEMQKKTADLYAEYETAVKNGNTELADDLLYEYKRNVQNMMLKDANYSAMVNETTKQISKANQTALGIANGEMAHVYTLSFNEIAKNETVAGYSFSLVDQETVQWLIDNEGSLLPDPSKKTLAEILQKTLDTGKDATWNKKLINSQVLQGILQGESIGTISNRLQNVTDMNVTSAIRNARTMVTNAENKGRTDSYTKASKDGVKLKKVWLATKDERTRVEHATLNGQERDNDEPFEVDGIKIMYPGDRTAPARMVYNCRCTLKCHVLGFKSAGEPEPLPKISKTEEQQGHVSKYGINMSDWDNKNMSNVFQELKNEDTSTANEFYKTLKGIGKPSEVWQQYIHGELTNEQMDAIEAVLSKHKNISPTPVMSKGGSHKKKTPKVNETVEKSDYEIAQEKLKLAQAELDAVDNKVYNGIWKYDVSVSDYEEKKHSIGAKKQYYNDKIAEINAKGDITDADKKLIDGYNKYLKDLDEFEALGKEYSKKQAIVEATKKEVNKLKPKPVIDTAITQERRDAGIWSKTPKDADEVLRDKCGEVWRDASKAEKDAIYEYTRSYHKFNEPLRGIEYGTEAYKGVGNTDLNAGYAKNGKNLNALTDIIEKSTYDDDIWLQRGCNYNGMDKFLGVDMKLLRNGTEEELQDALLGTTPTEYGFMSCGSAKGNGFSGDILMNVFAPGGTKMMYVEPFSAFGNGDGRSWDGKSKQKNFGHELETLLQQNTQFVVTKVERNGKGTIYIDLDVIGQNEPQRWKG